MGAAAAAGEGLEVVGAGAGEDAEGTGCCRASELAWRCCCCYCWLAAAAAAGEGEDSAWASEFWACALSCSAFWMSRQHLLQKPLVPMFCVRVGVWQGEAACEGWEGGRGTGAGVVGSCSC